MLSAEAKTASDVDTLIVTWQNPTTRTYYRVGVLTHAADESTYTFEYVRGVEDVEGFTPLVGLEDTDRLHTSTRLFPVFAERIMDSRRPGFDAWLRALHTDEHAGPMEILARSNGRRGSDTLQMFAMPLDSFFVHGVRHKAGAEERLQHVQPGQHLQVVEDTENLIDSRALIVADDGVELGWVPGPILSAVRALRRTEGWACIAERVDLSTPDPHQRLLVSVRGSFPPADALVSELLASPTV